MPIAYPIPNNIVLIGCVDVDVSLANRAPWPSCSPPSPENHLHIMIDAPGFWKLTTALYPDGDAHLSSDVVLGVGKSLVVVSNGYVAYTFSHRTHFLTLVEAGLFSQCTHLGKLTTNWRRASVGSRRAPSSSCSITTLSSSERQDRRWHVPKG